MLLNLLLQLKFLGGVYLGWGVGANDTANIFGPAVAAGSIKYRTAVILAAMFVFIGAVVEGPALMEKVAGLAGKNFMTAAEYSSINLAFIASIAAAVTITILIFLSIPASTSQAAVGSIMGIGIVLSGFAGAEWGKFFKMLVIWVSNPVLAAMVSYILFRLLARPVNYMIKSDIWYSRIFRVLLVGSGAYGAYALGASHAAVATALFYKSGFFGIGQKGALLASLTGGIGMVLGVVTYSRKVMEAVGKKITVLDPFSAFICVMGSAITVHLCKIVGVPVSTSQAIVGAVAGVGLVKGASAVNFRSLRFIFLGWIMTPVAGAFFSYSLIRLFL